MKSSTLALLGLALPRAECRTALGIEYHDMEGDLIGYVNGETFYLNADYEHYEKAKRAINDHGLDTEDWTKAKALYGEPDEPL